MPAREADEGRSSPPGYRLTAFPGPVLVAWRPDGWPVGAWPLGEASFAAAERAARADHARRTQLIREG